MKHNATYISLSLFILLYIALSNCANTLEKKESSNFLQSLISIHLPQDKANQKTCVLWKLSNLEDRKTRQRNYHLDICILTDKKELISDIIATVKNHTPLKLRVQNLT